jgi:hypothetical protein
MHRSGLWTTHQVPFADNADKPSFTVDNRNSADSVFEEQFGDLSNVRLGGDSNNICGHDVSRKHLQSPT